MIRNCIDTEATSDAESVLRLLAIIREVTARHDDPAADELVARFIADWCRHWRLPAELAAAITTPTRH